MAKDYAIVENVETLEKALSELREAQKKFATYTQEQVDKIFLAAATAANKARIPLAKMAVAETGMGVVEDKVIKNHYAAEYIYNAYKDTKTCGVLENDTAFGIKKIAEPIGVVAAVIPIPRLLQFLKPLFLLRQETASLSAPIPEPSSPLSRLQRLCLRRLSLQAHPGVSSDGLTCPALSLQTL